jgi:hypothetical protein
MKIDIPQGAKSMTLPSGELITIPDGAKSMEVPDELLIPKQIEKAEDVKPQAYNDVGNVHPAPVPSNEPQEEKSFWDKTKDFGKKVIDDTAFYLTAGQKRPFGTENKLLDEVKDVAKVGLDGLETGANLLNPLASYTGDIDIVDDSEAKKKYNEGKVDNSIIQDLEALSRIDIGLIKDDPEKKEKFYDTMGNILNKRGYDLGQKENGELVAIDDKGNELSIKNDFWESLLDGIKSDVGEISGAIFGAKKGYDVAKTIPNMYGKAAAIAGGSLVGAVGGNSLDMIVNDLKDREKLDWDEIGNELTKTAALDVAGTSLGFGVVKVGGKLIELPKQAKDYIVNGNINGAREILKKDSGIDEAFIDEALEQAVNSYKEVGEYSKKGITGKAKQQEELLATAQKDKRFGSALIHDTVLDNQDAAINVSKTIDKRAKDTIKTYEDISISGSDVKNSVNNYESKVHNQYTQMRDTFREAFKESDLKFDFRNMGIDSKISTALDDIVDPYQKETAENLRQKINKAIDNTKTGTGVSREIDNLIELRQSINEFYSRNQKNFKHDHKKLIVGLKQTLDDELEKAVREKLPKEAQKPMIDMFENAIKDYREMFEIQDTKLYKSLMSDGKNADDRLNGLIKHTADDEKEFETLLKKLPFEDQQKIENSIVGKFVNDNIIGKTNELQVIDYKKVSDGLEKLEEFFVTDSGKDSVKLMKDMALKYGDDFSLLRAATQAGVDTNAGIATTIKGRIEYKLAKGAYDRIMRLVPFSNSSKRLALQNHIAQALEKSRTPIELARKVIVSPDIPQGAKQDLREIIAEHTRVQKIKNEEDALEYEKAQGEKEYLKRKQEQKINDEIENFTTPSIYEIRAVETHTPDDRSGSFSQMTVKIAKGTATPNEIEQYVKAKNKIEPDVLEKTKLKNQYPVNSTAIEKLEELKSFDSTKVNEIIPENEFKSLIHHLKKDEIAGTTEVLKEKYRQKFYALNKLYDEAREIIDANKKSADDLPFEEAEKAGLIPFAKFGDNLLAGTLAGVETDDEGNVVGFNPEAFVIGLGGYTVAKQSAKYLWKNHGDKIKEVAATKLKKFIDSAEEDMAKMAGGGKPPVATGAVDEQGFYSVLEKVVDEKVGGKIDTVSLTKMLEKNGVKEDEMEWSGLKELMANNEKLTKEQIDETLKENRLIVEKVEKGQVNKSIQKIESEMNELKKDLLENGFDEAKDKKWHELNGKKNELNHPKYDDTKYQKYVLNGGNNYRELLFKQNKTLPNNIKIINGEDGYYYAELPPYDGTNVVKSAKSKKALNDDYTSHHWDEENVLVFTRVDDRAIDDKKTLFIEELQSDWHQEGRKKGYGKKIPNAPFKKNWAELGLKRMIQEAVVNDYDKIAWTTGRQQAKRYSLEKELDTIVYNKQTGYIQGSKDGDEVVFKKVATDEEVEAMLGKELTKRLIDPKSTTRDEIYVLSGDELKFGGDGMKAFYDEIVPNIAKKLFKKYKVKPKMEELDDIEEMVWSVDITPQMKEDIKKYGQPLYMVGGTIAAAETMNNNNGENNE